MSNATYQDALVRINIVRDHLGDKKLDDKGIELLRSCLDIVSEVLSDLYAYNQQMWGRVNELRKLLEERDAS